MRVEGTPANSQFDRERNRYQEQGRTASIAKPGDNKQPSVAISEEQVIRAIEKANDALVLPQTMFEFSIHEKTREIMVKVINEQTGEIIREIPPEKVLDMVAKMWEIAGILVDEKV